MLKVSNCQTQCTTRKIPVRLTEITETHRGAKVKTPAYNCLMLTTEHYESTSAQQTGKRRGWQYLVDDWALFADKGLEGEGEGAHGGWHWEERRRLVAVRVTLRV